MKIGDGVFRKLNAFIVITIVKTFVDHYIL
jgi:hypothetical protein